jgi:hypothetical protein
VADSTRPSSPAFTWAATPHGGRRRAASPGSAESGLSTGQAAPGGGSGATPPEVGPGSYAIPSPFSPSPSNVFHHSGGGYSLKSRTPHGSIEATAVARSASPGPGAYHIDESAAVKLSSHQAPPSLVFGKSTRRDAAAERHAVEIPGVGAYGDVSVPARAILPSSVSASFPRSPIAVVFRVPEEATLLGPGSHSPHATSLGKQVVSGHRSHPRYSMGVRGESIFAPGVAATSPGKTACPVVGRGAQARPSLRPCPSLAACAGPGSYGSFSLPHLKPALAKREAKTSHGARGGTAVVPTSPIHAAPAVAGRGFGSGAGRL